LAQVINLSGEVPAPQRHPEQEPQSGYDDIAAADAHARSPDTATFEDIRRFQLHLAETLQKRGKPFAAADVASLRSRTEFARIHVPDHALAQRADSIRGHR
jgi:hypothetical protein